MKAQEPVVKRIWNIYFWGRYAGCDGALRSLAMWASARKWSPRNAMQRSRSIRAILSVARMSHSGRLKKSGLGPVPPPSGAQSGYPVSSRCKARNSCKSLCPGSRRTTRGSPRTNTAEASTRKPSLTGS